MYAVRTTSYIGADETLARITNITSPLQTGTLLLETHNVHPQGMCGPHRGCLPVPLDCALGGVGVRQVLQLQEHPAGQIEPVASGC